MKQILQLITVTGADDSIDPNDLVSIAKEFPFVEFGILLSKKQQGSKRFPSRTWLEVLHHIWKKENLTLSGHLCGKWVRDICAGIPSFFEEMKPLAEMFKRIQLNFHAEPHEPNFDEFEYILQTSALGKDVIFQMDGENEHIFNTMEKRIGKISPLFDASGGCGVLPKEWPNPIGYCGYAGGLSPENVAEELKKISKVASDSVVWVDAETLLRSDNDRQFDLKKVRDFLKNAEPWVV